MHRRKLLKIGAGITGLVAFSGGVSSLLLHMLNEIEEFTSEQLSTINANNTNYLFLKYPGLQDQIPWMALGILPSPIKDLEYKGKKF